MCCRTISRERSWMLKDVMWLVIFVHCEYTRTRSGCSLAVEYQYTTTRQPRSACAECSHSCASFKALHDDAIIARGVQCKRFL
ncbi:hypothetical protein Tco_0702505 [Tanacetum coccineum]|uniref:Secreted protein n=1 Tax=Tanacetum coccineum TaxID=301880 RepID=A0ABQ4XW66_9ASTR